MQPYERIIIALDAASAAAARLIVDDVQGAVGVFKIGKELFTAEGPACVTATVAAGGRVFLDLKYHDIPNTVRGACRAAARLGVFMVNVHAAGGSAMMRAAMEGAAEGAAEAGTAVPHVLAVTVLTSLDDAVLSRELRINHSALDQVAFWAGLAQQSGLNGVVCSPREIKAVRAACGPDFLVVTPGIRPAWSAADDQKRITTPAQALADGADYIVIGRPITAAADRRAAAERVAAELAGPAQA